MTDGLLNPCGRMADGLLNPYGDISFSDGLLNPHPLGSFLRFGLRLHEEPVFVVSQGPNASEQSTTTEQRTGRKTGQI